MLKFLLRALFKPTYRPQTKQSRKPVRETLAYKAGRSITVSSAQPKTLEPDASNAEQSDAPASVEVFDETSSHSVTAPRVLEGPAYVTDGDTITIRKTQIRLFGIDAPELHHPYSKKAKWAMVRLCKGHKIRAEIIAEDEYGRTVAKCFLPDGRDLSEELVRQGLAIDWPKFSDGKYSSFEVAGIRKKLWLTDARQKGRMHVWEKADVRKSGKSNDK